MVSHVLKKAWLFVYVRHRWLEQITGGYNRCMTGNTNSTVQVFEQIPQPPLQPFVKRFLIVNFPDVHCDMHLPDTGSVAAFSFQGGCRLNGNQTAPSAAFTGLHETLRSHEHYQNHAVLLITFTPVGASAFLRQSLEEFAGTTTDMEGILGRPKDLERLHGQLVEAPNHGQRVRLVEEFLLRQLHNSDPDPLVTVAVDWLEQGRGAGRIHDLTRYIGLSQSALERRFRRVVGVSPKAFSSLVRLKHIVRLRTTGADFATVAHTAGYFDQSHFIKHFRRMTGSTPEAFFKQSSVN